MSKIKLDAARELITEKNYVEARALLLTIKDDPTAAKWLAKLEERMGANKTALVKALDAERRSPPPVQQIVFQERAAVPPPVQAKTSGTLGFFRAIWGIAFLAVVGWMCYGTMASAGDARAVGRSNTYQTATFLGGFTFVLCVGVPLALVFGLLYWRNNVAIREDQKHAETLQAMQNR